MYNPRVRNIKARLLFRNAGHSHKAYTDNMVKRIREKPVITTESIDFKAGHSASAKTNQAWRYAGGNIVRADSVMINGNPYTDPKSGGEGLARRKQESNFFITINSNKQIDPTDPKVPSGSFDMATKAMEHMLEKLSQESVMSTYLKFGPKSEHYINDKFVDVIHSISWNAAVERGDVKHRVHAHVWLTITHFSQIQINVQMLMYLARAHYNASVGSNSLLWPGVKLQMDAMPWVHVKLLPQADWTSVMRQYIHKGMTATSNQNAPGPTIDTAES